MTGIRGRIRTLTRAGRVPVSATATLAGIREIAPSYTRVRLVAPGLEAYRPTLPADGIKLEVPHGTGTSMRAFSVAARPAGDVVEVDILRHDGGVVGDWISSARLGDEVRRRVQQDTLGHRGRKGDPLYGIQTILRAGAENLTEKQRIRLAAAIEADPAHDEVFVAWQCAQQLRSAYHQKDLAEGRRIAEKVVDTFHTCPIPEIARLGLLHDRTMIERRN
ncbi:transposase [Bowdeniella nasicola]|uniref:transposase n=1 Tax=Bowdeniella nasicola TaxID=208480 RepID=UPI000B1C7FA6|nr:transposase [Bowdeniella nasicola]